MKRISVFSSFFILVTTVIIEASTREYSVKTADELRIVLDVVNPGDKINLADGNYKGPFISSRNGTESAPIQLLGSDKAVLHYEERYGFHLLHANYWILSGFSVTQSLIGVVLDYANFNIVQNLKVHGIFQEGIHLRFNSSDNIIRNNRLWDLGTVRTGYGEGIYIGRSRHAWTDRIADRCDRNKILNNHIGPDVRGESIDIKEGTCCGLIEGNYFDGKGMTGVHFDDAWVDMKGESYIVQFNIGSYTLKDGFWISNELPLDYDWVSACHNIFRNNYCDLQTEIGYCIAHNGTDVLDPKCNNQIYDNNHFSGGFGLTDGEILDSCPLKYEL